MARPLKANTGSTPVSLVEMTDGELAYPAKQILDQFVVSTTGTGTLSVNPGVTTGLTLIGSFTDTERPYNIGDHPVGTDVVSVTYNFYQDQRNVTDTPTARPLEFSTSAVREQADAEITAYIANTAIATLISSGQGTYKLQVATPTPGTWVSIATIKDEITGSSNTQYTLWRRTDGASASTVRPMKANTSPTVVTMVEMTDSELQALNTYFRNRIVNNSVGKYLLQNATPTPGTWVQMGTALSDTRQQLASNNYTGASYTPGAFTGASYSTNFTGGSYQTFFAGFGGTAFTGGFYTGFFTGGFYQGFYSGGFYAGNTIQSSTETVSTVYLWLRTA